MERLHIIDFGPELGFHWAPFIRQLASRPHGPPDWLKITTINVLDSRLATASEQLRAIARQLHTALTAAAEEASLPWFSHEVVEVVEGEEDVVTSLRRKVKRIPPTVAARVSDVRGCGCIGISSSNCCSTMGWVDKNMREPSLPKGVCDSSECIERCAAKRARASSSHNVQPTGRRGQEQAHPRFHHASRPGYPFTTADGRATGGVHERNRVQNSALPNGLGVQDCYGGGIEGCLEERERGVLAVCSAMAMEKFYDETAMRHSQRDALLKVRSIVSVRSQIKNAVLSDCCAC